MAGRRIAVRILGLCSTTRGFAFALTEGPRRLVTVGLRRVPPRRREAVKALDLVLRESRPLFVAFEHETSCRKRHRGKVFADVVTKSVNAYGILLLDIDHGQTKALSEAKRPTKWDISAAVAKLFPHITKRLPARRKPWQSENDDIGIFLALAAAVAAWEAFRKPRPDKHT